METMNTRSEASNIFVKSFTAEYKKSGDIKKAKAAGIKAVDKAGYIFKDGKFIKGDVNTETRKDKAAENKFLMAKIKSGIGVA